MRTISIGSTRSLNRGAARAQRSSDAVSGPLALKVQPTRKPGPFPRIDISSGIDCVGRGTGASEGPISGQKRGAEAFGWACKRAMAAGSSTTSRSMAAWSGVASPRIPHTQKSTSVGLLARIVGRASTMLTSRSNPASKLRRRAPDTGRPGHRHTCRALSNRRSRF
jgi:hypothetical protein